ncbi:hypothetical protein [Acetobacter pasteurianus]|uniref:hypothetical protein n=1 Tax=Acetobacter pasteurianus TaxID=438 RepID=UPI0003060651|nr:hypothetical protein [Acetobacter pasteurianus]
MRAIPRAAACITGRKKPNPIIPPLYAASPYANAPYIYCNTTLHAGFTPRPALAPAGPIPRAISARHGPHVQAWEPCQKPGPAALQETHGYAKSMPCVHPCYYGARHALPPPRRPA